MAAMRRSSSVVALRFLRALASNPTPPVLFARRFHSDDTFGGRKGGGENPFESADDFQKRLFSVSKGGGDDDDSFYRKLDQLGSSSGAGFGARSGMEGGGDDDNSFYRKLDQLGRSSGAGFGPRARMEGGGGWGGAGRMEGADSWGGGRVPVGQWGEVSGLGVGGGGGGSMSEGFDTLSDGLDSKLMKAAVAFEVSEDEDEAGNDNNYGYRPDVTFFPGTTYTKRDLDLTKPGIQKNRRREFKTTTAEVLKKADFRNVRFLANFLTEAGIIIKRSQTKISAKAQRKVAREIKTARAFGLIPFTTMGTQPFVFGRSRNPEDENEFDDFGAEPEPEPELEQELP